MGGGMAQLFAENGVEVSLEDPSEEAMDAIIESAKRQGFGDKINKFKGEFSFLQLLSHS
jgi:6-phosphogluconate dehydrogenase